MLGREASPQLVRVLWAGDALVFSAGSKNLHHYIVVKTTRVHFYFVRKVHLEGGSFGQVLGEWSTFGELFCCGEASSQLVRALCSADGLMFQAASYNLHH